MLANKKYCGFSFAYNTYSTSYPKPKRITNKGEHIKAEMAEHHEPIIPTELFDKVQEIRVSRSNVEIDENGNSKRKGSRYSSKTISK
ncbi:MAG: recombinase family protein [Eubacteriales bacterium]|nr:recombinase family protein [Eubacteriales bacterium]